MAHLLGYARVSTAGQNADLQVDKLQAAGCLKAWTDHASRALNRRPQLDEVLKQLRPVDTLVGVAAGTVESVAAAPDRRAEGHHDQSKSNLKQAGEKLKDVFK